MSKKNNFNTINNDDIKRLSGRLTKKEKSKLPASLHRIQGANQLSRTEVLEQEGLIGKAIITTENKKKHRFERLMLKDVKSKCEPMLGHTIRL